jgi:hypothetical protein
MDSSARAPLSLTRPAVRTRSAGSRRGAAAPAVIAAILGLAAAPAGCGDDEPAGLQPPGATGGTNSVATTAGASSTTGTSTSTSGETDSETEGGGESCNPLADPAAECGAGQACGWGDLQCAPNNGREPEGAQCQQFDPDAGQSNCAPGLYCGFRVADVGVCVTPCDATGACEATTETCVERDDGGGPGPAGICRPPCDVTLQDCASAPTEACYPARAPDGTRFGACLPAGTAAIEEPCQVDTDCALGAVCSDARFHLSGCGGEARCCAALCDTTFLPCLGADFECFGLGLTDQPAVGYCGTTPL